MSGYGAFAEAERIGWSDALRVSGYVKMFSPATDQAVDRLLDAAGASAGLEALDLCCGQGNVAEALVGRGCSVTGVDFSAAMLARARARVPQGNFLEGDAQALPLEAARFDIVVSNFGICHVPDQPRALAEARRVLRAGRRLALTAWCGAESSPCFDIIHRAIKAHGSPGVSPPPAPDFHQFARREEAEKLLSDAGFKDIETEIVECVWRLERPDDLLDIFEQGTVRAAMLLAGQPPRHRAAIAAAIKELVAEWQETDGRYCVPMPAVVVRGVGRC